jgi:hypothetical protein
LRASVTFFLGCLGNRLVVLCMCSGANAVVDSATSAIAELLRTGSFAIWEQDQTRLLAAQQAFLDQLFRKGVEDQASLDAHRRAPRFAAHSRVRLPGVAFVMRHI